MKTSRKNETQEKKKKHLMSQINARVWFLLLLVIAVLAVLGVRMLVQSLSTNEKYSRTALGQLNYSSTTKIAMPGDILDANGAVIATSYRVYILVLDPKVILATEETHKGSLEATVALLADTFKLDAGQVRAAIKDNPESSYLRYNKKTIVSEEQKAEFLEQQELINNPPEPESGEEEEKSTARVKGVWFDEEARRRYPYGELASKLIGYRTIDTSEGLWGLEKYYSEELKGINGREVSYINEDSDLEKSVTEPQHGLTASTTLDMNLHKMIADELEEWFAETDENGQLKNSAKSVSILAMDPNTGAIMAYVTDTDFNLNEPSDLSSTYSEEQIAVFEQNDTAYKEAKEAAQIKAEQEGTEVDFEWDSKQFPTTQDALNLMWRNTLISDSFEPGSTGKVMTYAAALEEGLIDADTLFDCSGSRQVANYNIKCHNYIKGGCGIIDSLTAVAASCNVAFIDIGLRLGREKFAKYQELFNFGQKTGVDLPGEASCEGLLYPVEKLNDVELVTNAFGQCFNVTRLQLAAAFCATINGGYYYKPYVVSELLDSDGAVVRSFEPTVVRQVVSEETCEVVKQALYNTVFDEEYGTGGGVWVSDDEHVTGISFIAKTGTAQKLPRTDNKYLISVISAAPMDNPKLVLYVTIDEYGGALQNDSAPAQYLSGDIWGTIHDYMGIFSEDDPGPDEYRYEEVSDGPNEAWPNGDRIIENLEGDPGDTPVPPEDDGSGTYNGIIVNPDSVINPEDALPQLPDDSQ